MDEKQQRILEDLTGVLGGELQCDPLTLSMYSTDGSLYQIRPAAVAFPRDLDDIVALARYSAETDLPLIPRGAGSGIAGSALGAGLVVDCSRHLRRIEAIGESTVRVQPGIVRDRLNAVLREHGRYFPPDPSNSAITTVGGMLAVDAAGSHSIRVGSTRDHVEGLQVVLGGGRTLEFGDELLPGAGQPVAPIGSTAEDSDDRFKQSLVSKLAKLLADNAELISERQPAGVRNTCGYFLRGVLGQTSLHVPRLLVGSEGTLGLFTSATLHTAPLPAHRGVVLMLFGELETAVRAVQTIRLQQPSSCDLLDRRLLTLAREADVRFASVIPPIAEAVLIVEQTGFSDRQVRDRVRMLVQAVRGVAMRMVVGAEAYSPDEVDVLLSLPAKVVPLLARLKGPARPLPIVEDVAVPPEAMHEFLVKAQRVFQKHQVTASLYAHAAAGQFHLRPFLPVPGPDDGPRIEAIARDLYQVVFSFGGSISGEHGDGLSRTAFIRSQYGPLYRVFQQVKDLFDPHNLMNPGKIVSDDPHVTRRNLRPDAQPDKQIVSLQLQWTPQQLVEAAAGCNGCGDCRTQSAELRMCPFFRVDPAEEASPRSKANVLRNYLCGELDPQDFTSPSMKRLANLCFNCKQCRSECPSHVNIPQMMIEAKAAYVAANGLNRADWILSRAHSFGKLGCAMSMAANWAIANGAARSLMEHLLGIARQRKLPTFSRRPFLSTYGRRLKEPMPSSNSVKPVVYFVDHYANYHDPELALACVAVLHHNGVPICVPPGQVGSGMAMISAGDLDAARDVAEQNIRELAELAREGHTIVCTEPAAALCLKHEYPLLVDHPDAALVADRVVEIGRFLEDLHQQGRLRTDFEPLDRDVGYHTPCHLKALANGIGGSPLERLLALIPQLRVHRIEKGCSGMAGAFGLTRDNFRTSVRIGWDLIARMRAGDLSAGTTECSSCKIQMEQGTATPTIHPLKLLALAYGVMPEIRRKLEPAKRKLVVT